MKKINDSNDSILLDNTEDIKLYKGIMNQKIGKKTIVIDEEISKKKRIINRLFIQCVKFIKLIPLWYFILKELKINLEKILSL